MIREAWARARERWGIYSICILLTALFYVHTHVFHPDPGLKNAVKAVVMIENEKGMMIGTGFFFSSNGCLLTAQHVINDFSKKKKPPYVKVYQTMKQHEAKIIAESEVLDSAILCVEGLKTSHWLDLRNSLDVWPGDKAYTIGHPMGHPWFVDSGTVNRLSFRNYLLTRDIGYATVNLWFPRYTMYTTSMVLWGNSGGPVLDSRGRVIGLVTNMGAFGPTRIPTRMGMATTGTDLIRFVNSAKMGDRW